MTLSLPLHHPLFPVLSPLPFLLFFPGFPRFPVTLLLGLFASLLFQADACIICGRLIGMLAEPEMAGKELLPVPPLVLGYERWFFQKVSDASGFIQLGGCPEALPLPEHRRTGPRGAGRQRCA